MSSSTVSKRLCAVIPRQTRALSLYSHPHLTLDSVPPPQPYARPSPVATSRTPTSQSSSPHSQTQPSQPLTPSAPLQTIPSPLPRSAGQSSNSNSQVSLFPSTSFFPSNFPYFTPGSLHAPVVKRSRLTYQLNTGAYGIPKRRAHTIAASAELDLAVQVGEDAYFLRPDAMGVADGVGGWSKAAPATANSALFSKSLMHYCSYELSMLASPPAPPVVAHVDAHVSTIPDIHPIDILQRSYNRCLRSFQKQGFTGGSATALLALLRDEELRIAHLGDCALCLIRDGGIIYRSEEMQHAFNYPLQLGPASPTLPVQARSISIPVQPDDILILSSDGMTDNLWDEDVLDEVTKFTETVGVHVQNKWLPGMLSQALCSRAKSASERRGKEQGSDEVPFARKAREEGIRFVGGKCDDISVLVAVISPYPDQERTSL